MPILITKDNYEQEITKAQKPVVLEVFATWCGPCKQMAPLFEELEKELEGTYKFAKLNVDESRDLAIKFGVTSIPTFVFLKQGTVLAKEIGYMNKQDLHKKIETHLA